MAEPAPNGNGRDAKGRFANGNSAGGNPFAGRINEWRKALCDAVSPADVTAVVERLVKEARLGKGWAIQLFLERCLGKPQAHLDITTGGDAVRSLTDDEAAAVANIRAIRAAEAMGD